MSAMRGLVRNSSGTTGGVSGVAEAIRSAAREDKSAMIRCRRASFASSAGRLHVRDAVAAIAQSPDLRVSEYARASYAPLWGEGAIAMPCI